MAENDNYPHEHIKHKQSAKQILISFLELDDIGEEVIEGLRDKIKEDVLTCKLMEMYAKREKDASLTRTDKILGSPALTHENGERLILTKKIMDSYKDGLSQYSRGVFMYDILAGQYKLEESQKGASYASYRRNLKAILQMQGDLNNFLFKKSRRK